jgi:hypothetical protein
MSRIRVFFHKRVLFCQTTKVWQDSFGLLTNGLPLAKCSGFILALVRLLGLQFEEGAENLFVDPCKEVCDGGSKDFLLSRFIR